MDITTKTYNVYIKIDDKSRITAINSDAFISSLDGWVYVDCGKGDRYYHAQGNYLDKSLTEYRGLYRYKFTNNSIIERTQEEMDEDYTARPASSPGDAERIAALEAQLAAYEAAYQEGVNEA